MRKWRKTNFGPDFGPFWPKFGPLKSFHRFYLYAMLYIVASYHCMQFQWNLISKTWENGKKPSFGPNFGPFGPNSKIWLRQSLDIMVSYHHIQYQKKLMIQSWENAATDGRTDGRTDGQQDWFHRTLSD